MNRIPRKVVIAAALASSSLAFAQATGYAGPANKAPPRGCIGPTSVPQTTVKELLANGRDDQYVRLQGKLLNHKNGDEYEFVDASGRLTVEIDARRFSGWRAHQSEYISGTVRPVR